MANRAVVVALYVAGAATGQQWLEEQGRERNCVWL